MYSSLADQRAHIGAVDIDFVVDKTGVHCSPALDNSDYPAAGTAGFVAAVEKDFFQAELAALEPQRRNRYKTSNPTLAGRARCCILACLSYISK